METRKVARKAARSKVAASPPPPGNLTQIAKMAERTERAFPDRILLPVTAAIYHNGQEKPAMRWSFEMGIGDESDKDLFDFLTRLREGYGIGDRCSQLKILK